MYRIAIVSDPANIHGFRLAGVDSYMVRSVEEASRIINILLNEDTVGIIAVNESYMEGLDARTLKKIDSIYRPIVVALPIEEAMKIKTPERIKSCGKIK